MEELRAVWAGFPRPGETWHPGVAEIRRVDGLIDAAFEALEADEAAGWALEVLLDADEAPALDVDGTGDALDEARALLAALPRPEGRHPYLDEILPAFEAAALVLAALAESPAARARMAELVATAPGTAETHGTERPGVSEARRRSRAARASMRPRSTARRSAG